MTPHRFLLYLLTLFCSFVLFVAFFSALTKTFVTTEKLQLSWKHKVRNDGKTIDTVYIYKFK